MAVARVLVTQDQALHEAFPKASLERKTAYLTPEQAKKVEEMAGTSPTSKVVTYYVATAPPESNSTHAAGGRPAILASAWFDTHIVRTLPETVMVVVSPAGTVMKVEILSFEEPVEYMPRPRWFDEFAGKKLDRDLAPGGAIPSVTGATLSSRAVTAATRRVLALHSVLISAPLSAASAAPAPPPPPPEAKP